MSVLFFISFMLIVAAILLLLHINRKQIYDDWSSLKRQKETLAYKIKSARGDIKPPRLQNLFREIQTVLSTTKSESRFTAICITTVIALVVLIFICVLFQKYFIIPAAVFIAVLMPIIYIKNLSSDTEKQFSFELETSLNIVTSAYIGGGEIIDAVQESLPYMREPIKSVFTRFLGRTKAINCDIISAIDNMKFEVKNDIFHEWCDNLKESCRNSDLRYILQPTVMKYTDERIVNAQLETKLVSERKDYYTMLILTLVNIPLLYLLNADWFSVLVNTIPGQIVTGSVLIICILLTMKMKHLTRPVKYRR